MGTVGFRGMIFYLSLPQRLNEATMALFKVKAKDTKVSGHLVEAFLEALPGNARYRAEFLKRHGIEKVDENSWYPMEEWLEVFEDVANNLGKATLFILGKAIFKALELPRNIKSLEDALKHLNEYYQKMHQGNVGEVKLVSYDEDKKQAIVESTTSYPSDLERGVLTELARSHMPEDAIDVEVIIDESRSTKEDGAESTFYIIQW